VLKAFIGGGCLSDEFYNASFLEEALLTEDPGFPDKEPSFG